MNKLQQMQTFLAVADAGSFVGASEELGISKTAVSRQVSELETRLGVRLIQRTTRRLALTDDGKFFLHRTRSLLDQIADTEEEISSRGNTVQGALRINAPVSFGIRHLSPLWGHFQQLHPNVRLDVTLSDNVVDLIEEGFDLAVRIGTLADSTLVSRTLTQARLVLCAAPAYLDRNGRPSHPNELSTHQTIGYSYWAGGSSWQFDCPGESVTVRISPALVSNNGETCVQAAIHGQGICLQPDFLVSDAVANGDLSELLPEFTTATRGVYAVFPNRKHIAPKVRAVLDFLAQSFSSIPPERPVNC